MSDMRHDSSHLDKLLRRANPVREHELPIPAEATGAQQLYQRITGTPYAGRPAPRGVRHRRLIAVLAAVMTTAGVGGVAAYASLNHSVTKHFAVSCYAGPSLDAKDVAVDALAGGPVATCAQAWSEGHVGNGAVPLLAACITPQGIAAVFPAAPGADVCAQLGLPALPPGAETLPANTTTTGPTTTLTAEGLPVPIRDAIITNLQRTCLTAPQAQESITALLTKADIPWKVAVPTPFPPERPCASPGFDEIDQTVVLTGIPRPGN